MIGPNSPFSSSISLGPSRPNHPTEPSPSSPVGAQGAHVAAAAVRGFAAAAATLSQSAADVNRHLTLLTPATAPNRLHQPIGERSRRRNSLLHAAAAVSPLAFSSETAISNRHPPPINSRRDRPPLLTLSELEALPLSLSCQVRPTPPSSSTRTLPPHPDSRRQRYGATRARIGRQHEGNWQGRAAEGDNSNLLALYYF
uniref:Uncharacterized protein n=1 Tax=Oryza glumipatula TaxID=40148 RepID=A0A0E0B3P3_9ORYZ